MQTPLPITKILPATAILLVASLTTFSQVQLERDVTASGGGHAISGGIILSYTIGEPAVTTLSGTTSILTQGFQQPDLLLVNVEEFPVSGFVLNCFPNPVISDLNIYLTPGSYEKITILVVDASGRKVIPPLEKILAQGVEEKITVDMSGLAPAVYLVRIVNRDDKQLYHTRILKVY